MCSFLQLPILCLQSNYSLQHAWIPSMYDFPHSVKHAGEVVVLYIAIDALLDTKPRDKEDYKLTVASTLSFVNESEWVMWLWCLSKLVSSSSMYAYWIPVKMSWFKMFSHLRSQANLVPKLSNVINICGVLVHICRKGFPTKKHKHFMTQRVFHQF